MAGSSSEAYYRETNSSPAYNNPRFVALIVNKAAQGMQRNLSSSEVSMVANFIRKLDMDALLRMPQSKVIASLTSAIISRLARYQCEDEPDHTREFLRDDIGISGETDYVRSAADVHRPQSGGDVLREAQASAEGGIVEISRMFGYTKPSQIQKILNPGALLRTNYILMDTRYRALDNDGTRYFQWNHINNVTRAQGSVNTVGTIRDIVAMRVYPFRIPYTSALDTSYKKLSMLMREFQAQSFVAHENRRFHFMFDVFIDGDSIYLKPEDNNDAYYRFNQPITQIDNISIDFGSPLEEVVFDADRSLGTAAIYGPVQTQITTQSPHNLLTGNLIYITGFSSLNSLATPTVIAQMNRAIGHPVIVSSPTALKVLVDSSSMLQLIQGGPTVTINANAVIGVTPPVTLNTGDRVRLTDSAAPPFANDYGVFVVVFYTPNIIFLDSDVGLGVPTPCYVFKDYRPPPLTRNDGLAAISPAGGISLNNTIVTSTSPTLSSEYKVGDTIYLYRTDPVFYELSYTVTSLLSSTQLTINRVILGAEANLTAVKVTRVQDNIFQVYYGGKRIFIPIELTYIAPES